MMQEIQNYQTNANISFQALRQVNPKKMTPEMRDALKKVEGLFDPFPKASVRLKNTSRLEDNTYYTYGQLMCEPGRTYKSSLIFNLGKDSSGKSRQFTLDEQRHTSFKCFSSIEYILSQIPNFPPASWCKRENWEYLTTLITPENIQRHITEALKG